MSEQPVIYEKSGRLAYITLNRPEALNAMDSGLSQQLRAALSDFDLDPEPWVAIVSGSGRCFCAGADLRKPGDYRTDSSRIDHYYLEHPVNWKPVIAAVHGYCYGNGLAFAAECDVIVATEDATFSIVETKRGMPPVTIFAQLAAWMGSKKVTEMILTGEPLSAQDAHRLGLVNRLVPSREDLLPAAEEIAEQILQNPPLAVRTSVQAARRSAMQSQTHREAELLFKNCGWKDTEDFKEGIQAFREGRKPVYVGR
jgi:enoyl-CoA hydratase/carnithine racemase